MEEERDQEEAIHAGGKQSRLGLLLAIRPPGAARDGLYLGHTPVVEHLNLHRCLSDCLLGRRLVQGLTCLWYTQASPSMAMPQHTLPYLPDLS